MITLDNRTIPHTNVLSLKRRRLQRYNLLKYRVICAMLDYMAFCNGAIFPGSQQQNIFTEQELHDALFSNGIISKRKYNIADYNSILAEMCFMNLIRMNNGMIAMTEYTIEAYSKQHFHQILSSLVAAEDSRVLSHRTLIVSTLAVIVSVVSIWISLMDKCL